MDEGKSEIYSLTEKDRQIFFIEGNSLKILNLETLKVNSKYEHLSKIVLPGKMKIMDNGDIYLCLLDSLTIVKAETGLTELVRPDKTSSISSFDVLSNGDFIIALKFGSFLFKLKTDGTWERFIDVKMPSSVLINRKDEIYVAHEMFE